MSLHRHQSSRCATSKTKKLIGVHWFYSEELRCQSASRTFESTEKRKRAGIRKRKVGLIPYEKVLRLRSVALGNRTNLTASQSKVGTSHVQSSQSLPAFSPCMTRPWGLSVGGIVQERFRIPSLVDRKDLNACRWTWWEGYRQHNVGPTRFNPVTTLLCSQQTTPKTAIASDGPRIIK